MASKARHSMCRAAFAVAVAIAGTLSLAPTVARADESLAEVSNRVIESAQELDEANERLEEATAHVDEVQALIDENQSRVAEIEAALPEQRERAASSLVTLYKMSQDAPGLMDLVLSSDTFYDLLATLQYLDIIQSRNNDAVEDLIALNQELDQTRRDLDAQMAEAEAAQAEAEEAQAQAEEALAEAIALREELERQAMAQAAAEEAARQAAILEAERAAAEHATFTTASGSEVEVEVPDATPAEDEPALEDDNQDQAEEPVQPTVMANGLTAIDWSVGQDAFVSTWGARIDAYLAGSPMAGYGSTFAAASWAYGVDPRWSPAIANTESSKGLYCFLPYNAWGWGSSSWSSWDEAIWAHVGGLASGYGSTISLAAAQRYCPPNASYWYSKTLAQMQII